jgi:hypothetical protein
MKKTALLLAVSTLALTWLAPTAPILPAAHARAQVTNEDSIDPIFALTFTEAINNHNPDGVLQHFVEDGRVVFENSMFGLPSKTMAASEYAARQRPNQPDVPTDIHIEIVDGSVQIDGSRASWIWRETAGFLKDMKVDYIEFDVVATTRSRKFETIALSPTVESLAKLISLAPTKESLARLPYSPAMPTLPFAPDGSIGPAMVVVQIESVGGSKVRGAAIVFGRGTEGDAHVSLHVTGLTQGTAAEATVHAGTCTAPSASFASLPELRVDSSGTGTATGPVLFRGMETVALATAADGDHVISISQSGRVVACGKITAMEGVPDYMPGMPRTGGSSSQIVLILLAMMAAGLVLAGVRVAKARRVS